MLERIFPKQFDNVFGGHFLAVWLFGATALMELAMGANALLNTRTVAASADGIPIDQYVNGGAQAVVALFALAGLFRLLLALQSLLVLVRYRAMIPLMFLIWLVLHLGSKGLVLLHPVARSGVSSAQLGSFFVYAIIAMLILGFALSFAGSSKRAEAQSPPIEGSGA
jgi:predicted neutral ceramidase superfamily lipid hydrolase